MRKYAIIVALLTLILVAGYGQDYKIGIKIAPTLSNVRTATEGQNSDIRRNGTAVKFLLGAFVDLPFKENYFFQGGVNFASKSTNIRFMDNRVQAAPYEEEYMQEYLQVPLLLKFYTNEVVLDTRLYFNFGLVPEILLTSDNKTSGNVIISKFQPVDLSGNFGGGVEKSIGVNTRVFIGLAYNIGFLNTVKTQSNAFDEIKLKSNLISLEFGIKF